MKKYYVIILLIAAFAMSGCAMVNPRRSSGVETPKSLEVSPLLKFEDVPVPSSFKIMPNDSFIFDNDVTRLGILRYSGGADASSVARFYREQMPLYNWRFINFVEFNTRIINFERDDQTCIVIIEPHQLSTVLTVSVAPKAGRASTYKAEKGK